MKKLLIICVSIPVMAFSAPATQQEKDQFLSEYGLSFVRQQVAKNGALTDVYRGTDWQGSVVPFVVPHDASLEALNAAFCAFANLSKFYIENDKKPQMTYE